VLADDPRLDVRAIATQRQPHLVIVDSALQTPTNAQLFAIKKIATQATNTPARGIFIYTNSDDLVKKTALEAKGVTVITLPNSDASKRVDLAAMMHDLAKREINELHVEAGATLNGALIEAGLVDEFLIYLAPKLLGAGRGMADFSPLKELSDAMALEFISADKVGEDLRIVARPLGRTAF
jgi:diaminohydroxyphosphoribosylaminopyrimidine deaminase/5-amino-6-(5-phosphoribosylamino)uracil reductase